MKTTASRDPELAQVHTVSETLGPLAPSVVVCSLDTWSPFESTLPSRVLGREVE